MKFTNVTIANIGLYNVAGTVSSVVQSGVNASGLAIGPMLLKAYKNKDERLARNIIFFYKQLFFLVTFLISLWLKEIFFILIKNDSLQKVYPLGIILIMGYNYRPMYFGANTRLFYYEKTKDLLKVSFIAGLSNVILNFIFIPIFGYEAAAYTTFFALMYMGYVGYFLKAYKAHCTLEYHPLKWLSITLLLSAIVYYLVEIPVIYKICISVILILVLIFY